MTKKINEGLVSVNVEEEIDVSRIRVLAGLSNSTTVSGSPVVFEENSEEYNDESGMAHNGLRTMQRAIESLMNTINEGDNLPEWCQEKLALAEDYLTSVKDYLQSDKGIEQQ